ncbi:translocation/assembly module TamB domain-containing protein [Hyphomonas sp.]|uniref:translocation/assembly module TamB domain-containing protein n=1 Tax=Hyphomonas sp. TaxID=87 RepID=UPI003918F553
MAALASIVSFLRRRPVSSAIGLIVLFLGLIVLTARWWIATDSGRDFVVSQIDGREVAGYGRLSVRKLEGDPLTEFTLGSLEIRDATGVWVNASDIRMRWSPLGLLSRKVDLETVGIGEINILRLPVRQEQPKSEGGGWAVKLERGAISRLTLTDGVAGPQAAYSVSARFINDQNGTFETELSLIPLEGAGDRIDARILRDRHGAFDINAEATAPAGGTFAHLLKLPEGASAILTTSGAGDLSEGLAEATLAIDGANKAFLSAKIEDKRLEAGLRLDAYVLPIPADLRAFLGPEAEADLVAVLGNRATDFTLDTRFSAGTAKLTGKTPPGRVTLSEPAQLQANLSTLEPFWDGASGLVLDGRVTQEKGSYRYAGEAQMDFTADSNVPFASVRGPVEASYEDGRIPFSADVIIVRPFADNGTLSTALGDEVRLTGNGVYDLASRRLVVNAAELAHKSGTAQLLGETGISDRTLNFSGRISQALSALPGGVTGNANGFVQLKGAYDDLELGVNLNLAALSIGTDALKPLVDGPGTVRGIVKIRPERGSIQRLDVRLTGFEGQLTGALYGPGAPDLNLAGDQRVPLEISGNVIDLNTVNLRIAPEDDGLRINGTSSGGSALVSGRQVSNLASQVNVKFLGGSVFGPVSLSGISNRQPASASFYLDRRPGMTRLENLKGKLADIVISGAAEIADDGALDLDVDAQAASLSFGGVSFGSLSFKGAGNRGDDAAFAIGGEFRAVDIALTSDFTVDLVTGTIETTPEGYRIFGRLVDQEDGKLSDVRFGGVLSAGQGSTSGTLSLDGTLFGIAIASRRDIAWALEPTFTLDADISALGGRIAARLRPDTEESSNLISIDNLNMEPVLSAFGLPPISAVVSGRASGNPFGEVPAGTLALVARSPVSGIDASIDLRLNGVLDRNGLSLTSDATYGPDLKLNAVAQIPVITATNEIVQINRAGDMRGRINLDGKLDALALVAIAYGHDIGGSVTGQFDLSGSLEKPVVNGEARIKDGLYEYGAMGLRLTAITLDAGIENDLLAVTGNASGPGGGKATFNGRLAEREAGIEVKLDRLLVYDRAGDIARVSGTATLDELSDHRLLSGKLTVDHARFAIDNLSGSSIRTLNVRWSDDEDGVRRDPLLDKPIRMNLDVSAPRGIVFHGRGLETDWGVNLVLTGTPDNILLNGRATLARGSLELAQRPFEFESGLITFDGPLDTARMAIAANRQVDGFNVRVDVGGAPTRPTIELSSTPSLPQDEILSRMLFGRSSVDLTALEAAELAASIARLSGQGGGLDPLGAIQAGLGIDRLRFGVDDAGNTELGVGQYLASDVYLEVTTQGAAGNSVEVEWQPRPQVSVSSETSSTGESRVSVRWKRDY